MSTAAVRDPAHLRALLLRLAWKHTHRDFKGKWKDGTKSVLNATPAGTSAVPLHTLTNEELLAKIPAAVRKEIDL